MSIGNKVFKRVVAMSMCSLLILLAMVACGDTGSGTVTPTPSGPASTTATQASPTTQPTTKPTTQPPVQPVPFKVAGVDMSVSPTSITGMSCGTNVTVTYTATFHAVPGSNGGTVQFQYPVNNGRGSSPGSLTFGPGVTTRTYSFTWSGALPADHTYPEPGGVIVTSPNSVNSQLIGPAGKCS